MFNYIFYRAKNQWKLLLLLWISFLIANAFIISGPTYLSWVKKMIYEDGLINTPPTTRNVSITTGSQPLIRDSYEKNNSIIDDLANQHLEELFLEKKIAYFFVRIEVRLIGLNYPTDFFGCLFFVDFLK